MVILIIIIILNLALFFSGKSEVISEKSSVNLTGEANPGSVNMLLPAIDDNGNGMTTKLRVEAKKGEGRTLVEVDNILFFEDTQHSIRVAKLVAQDNTGINISALDLIYSVDANASIIGGPSAGAALTIATISALTGRSLRSDVMISGTINRDGSIGPVSDILAKAEAASKVGAKTFLVPLLQSRDVIYETNQSCEKFGNSDVCTTETKPRKVNLTEETGISIVEVGNITEAESYFFS